MYQVQPVRSRELQQKLAEQLECRFIPDTYAMYAGELGEDYSTVTELIGMCQFTFGPGESEIKSLAAAPGHEEDEAVTVLVRAVMSLVNNAEIPLVTVTGDVIPEDRIKKLGFRRSTDTPGKWFIELEKFYMSPCSYTDASGKQ